MGSQKVILAVIFKNPSNDDEYVLIKQNPPSKFNDPEYDSYQDSQLWDLPSAHLPPIGSQLSSCLVQIEAEENSLPKFLNKFDLDSALAKVLEQVGLEKTINIKWSFSKVVDEPEFGPGNPAKTLYIVGKLEYHDGNLGDCCIWMSTKGCANLLQEVKPGNDRIGPLVVLGLLNDSMPCTNIQISPTLRSQEYPPGVKLIPMRSRTAKPFQTTNLVVFSPLTTYDGSSGDNFVLGGDALIIDPGCSSIMHIELEQIIKSLPRKLIVFVTHHHHDHIEGLSIVQKCNPDATLVAHKNTFNRITKDDWSLGYVPVLGSEEICVRGQRLRLISAPGHTDGHLALLHVTTNSLIVGDHCVGQGSALLDIASGGNMSDYFHTTYNFMELSPNVLIPMHGRVNMWPKHMLCGYLKNRRSRESSILKAIENGAKTLFDIVSSTYGDVDRSLWIHAASNVRLHVDHIAEQNKLPKEFSRQRFISSCKLNFFSRWVWEYLCCKIRKEDNLLLQIVCGGAAAASAFGVLYFLKPMRFFIG